MNNVLRKRVARLEEQQHGDWRQFGNDPRDMPDWALVASILWDLENTPGFKARTELIDARRLYDAGDIDAASNSLRPILEERLQD